MNKNAKDYIKETIRSEGFHYALNDYSFWDEIDDDKFQNLLANYKQSIKDLQEYLYK